MAIKSKETSEILQQIDWLIKIYWSAKWAGVLAGLAIIILAVFMLNQKENQTYTTRILYGMQPMAIKLPPNGSTITRLAPVIPENFKIEPGNRAIAQLSAWYETDFISTLVAASNQRYSALNQVGFSISAFSNGLLVKTVGKPDEQEFNREFHKRISEFLLKLLHQEDARVASEIKALVSVRKQLLAGIKKSREGFSAEQERSVELMENIVENTVLSRAAQKQRSGQEPGGNVVFVETMPNDGFSNIVLALAKRREDLTRKSDSLRRSLANYERFGKLSSRASVDILAYAKNSKGNMSFVFKLSIWLFLLVLVVLTAPFLWAGIRAIGRELKNNSHQQNS